MKKEKITLMTHLNRSSFEIRQPGIGVGIKNIRDKGEIRLIREFKKKDITVKLICPHTSPEHMGWS